MPEPVSQSAELSADADRGDALMRRAIELMFFAYRDFTGEADAILAEYGFGRAHHRAVYFIGRNPGIAVNELLAILKITKQSLARVLGQLIEEGYVAQRADQADGRRRLLSLTEKGSALEQLLTGRQSERIRNAVALAGEDAGERFERVLEALIDDPASLRLSADVAGCGRADD
jgi:DNA-binding MarR family transcriptional regulator